MQTLFNLVINCFRQITWQSCLDCFSVISTILVFLTLKEMQKERENTYRPDILIGSISVWVGIEKQGHLIEKNTIEHTTLNSVVEIHSFYNNPGIILKAINAGVGSAKNVNFSVDKESMDKVMEYLKEKFEYECTHDSYGYYFGHGAISKTTLETELLYMKAQAEQVYSVEILNVLAWALSNVLESNSIKEKTFTRDFPPIKLRASFYDVQDIRYEKEFVLNANWDMWSTSSPDENGNVRLHECMLTITPEIKKLKKQSKFKTHKKTK